MVRAVNGMLKEQTHIFRSFIVSILFFAASTASTFWVIMSKEMAIVCTIIIMISSGFWCVCFVFVFPFRPNRRAFQETAHTIPSSNANFPAHMLACITCSHGSLCVVLV
jgi:hypothetical protein